MNLLTEGDIIELKYGHEVYADIPEHFVYSNRGGSWKLCHVPICIDTALSHLKGRYVVYKTCIDGGGAGSRPGDISPDGHHVFCEKLDDSGIKVDFYQTGCFTGMIPHIKPIGRAVRKWVEPKEGEELGKELGK